MPDLAEARQRVRDRFGSAVAEKASDAFVRVHGGQGVGASEAALPAGRLPTMIEFTPEASTAVKPEDARRTAAWESAVRAVAELIAPWHDSPAHAMLRAASVVRRSLIGEFQAAFSRDAGAVLDEIGRAVGGPLGPLSEGTTLGAVQSRVVETCWLNRTARTGADPMAVAGVAAASEVRAIDVPRRLTRELTLTPDTVGAPAFRAAHGLSGSGVIVAVVDSEVAVTHPALSPRAVHKSNFTKEPWGFPDGHGTAVAGIIGAESSPIRGMAPGVTIWNYKVLATNPLLDADDFGGARAIQQALEDGAHIANCSWGAGPASDGSSREARACDTAWSLGLTIVKSAGNRGPGASTLTTPADANGIIVVGGTDRRGLTMSSDSSRGPTLDGRTRPHLVAPGGTPSESLTSLVPGGGSGSVGHGTSYAAPHVSGLLALLLERDPTLDPDALRQAIVALARPLAGFGPNDQGAGLLVMA